MSSTSSEIIVQSPVTQAANESKSTLLAAESTGTGSLVTGSLVIGSGLADAALTGCVLVGSGADVSAAVVVVSPAPVESLLPHAAVSRTIEVVTSSKER
jgi:hypothetical protein